MRRDLIKNVEIVEPPIEELSKKYSAFSTIKRTCLGGCGCLVVLLIGLGIFLRLSMGAGPQSLKSVPANFPADIPVYDKDNIDRITYISGQYKNRGLEIAAFFPKIILSPLFMALNKGDVASTSTDTGSSIKNLWKLISSPVSDHRDTLQIEWKNLSADPFFVVGYYKTELEKAGYKIDVESESDTIKQFSFSKGDVAGSMFASGSRGGQGNTDSAILTLTLPPQ